MPETRTCRRALRLLPLLAAVAACAAPARSAPEDEHAEHAQPAAASSPAASGTAGAQQAGGLPAGAADAQARLAASPRHGEWVVVKSGPTDSVRAWIVYPERKDKAPVVVVIHEIFGLSNWIRAVTDQLAADGFIAIAPDLLTMENIPNTEAGEPNPDSARAHIRTLSAADVNRDILAVARYGMNLPAAKKSYGVVGFCWGGTTSFAHAVASPELDASVVYYGTSPSAADLAKVKAPVLGLYGGDDARVDATIPPADSTMKALGKTYEPHIFPGAGHGFLRAQDGREGANLAATKQAWPLTVAWFRKYLDRP